MSDETFLDPAAVAKLRKLGGDKLVRDMINIFMDYVPQRLEAARAGEQAGDWTVVEKAIHPLKSSGGHVGARDVHELAVKIEKLAMDKNAEAVPPALRELEAAFLRVKPHLEQERDR